MTKGKDHLTPEQQKLSDEATVFVLAGTMVATYQMMQAKHGAGVAEVMIKVGIIIGQDPSFLKRFEEAQKVVMEEYNKMLATPKIHVVPANAKLPGLKP